jgi:hypothetical protein
MPALLRVGLGALRLRDRTQFPTSCGANETTPSTAAERSDSAHRDLLEEIDGTIEGGSLTLSWVLVDRPAVQPPRRLGRYDRDGVEDPVVFFASSDLRYCSRMCSCDTLFVGTPG